MSKPATKRGIAHLCEAVDILLNGMAEIKERLVCDQTRPLTASQLCERWNVAGETSKTKLRNLGRLCERRRVQKLTRQRGWHATYSLSDVVSAEGRKAA